MDKNRRESNRVWICPNCKKRNSGEYCIICGTSRGPHRINRDQNVGRRRTDMKRNGLRILLFLGIVSLVLSGLLCLVIIYHSDSLTGEVSIDAATTAPHIQKEQDYSIETVGVLETNTVDVAETQNMADTIPPTEATLPQLVIPPESELFCRSDYLQVKDGVNLFSILPKNFEYSSGAGGWLTHLNIYEDGSFDGYYRDYNLGENDKEYPNGTCYICDFSGSFSSPQKVSDYVYSVSVRRLDYPKDVGTEWVEDGMRYIQAEPYGLDKTREYFIYLPGCPYSVFTQEQLIYISQVHDILPQGQFCMYARDGSSNLCCGGNSGNCIFLNRYKHQHGVFRSELWPNGLFGMSNLVFWPEDGASEINLKFNWMEDDQRRFVAEDEGGSGEYEVNLYVAKDMRSVFVMVQSLQGKSLESWGGTLDGKLTATYSLMESEDDSGIQAVADGSGLDKSTIEVGKHVYFGQFEQDNNLENGKEPIEWRVLALDRNGEQAFLISRYALTARCYHNGETYPTWANSNIRGWLNGQFLWDAFTEKEQSAIVRSKLSNSAYEGIDGGKDTLDRIFLISREEAANYFTGSADRLVEPTEYARAMGAGVADENGCCWWWLRTPGTYMYDAGLVYAVGGIDHTGGNVKNSTIAVRPALWVKMS